MSLSSSKINVLFLTDCLADLAGGAEKQIYELAKRLDKSRFNVIVVSLDCYGRASPELIKSAGAQLFIFKVKRIYGISGWLQGIRFRSFLKEKKIDIIQTYHFSSDIWGTFWGRLAGVPVIISNRRDMGFWRKSYHVWAYRLFNAWVSKIVVVSESIKKMAMQTEGVSGEKIQVIYNGIDLRKPDSTSRPVVHQEIGIKGDELAVMHVANLKPVKGHPFLIKAAAEAAKVFPQFKIVLIGKDEFNGQLQAQARELGITDKIIFLGKREDVPRLLAAADICVLPSLSEGMSNAILEYMLAGKPVITTDVGGNPELVRSGFNGLLVEPENAEQLKDALLSLFKDQSQRERLGQNSLKAVQERFSMDQMISDYENLFKSKKSGGY